MWGEIGGKVMKDEVTISRDEYDELIQALELLNCLEACGVDNWSGYSDACEMMEVELR